MNSNESSEDVDLATDIVVGQLGCECGTIFEAAQASSSLSRLAPHRGRHRHWLEKPQTNKNQAEFVILSSGAYLLPRTCRARQYGSVFHARADSSRSMG
jgi:hypothetical protein